MVLFMPAPFNFSPSWFGPTLSSGFVAYRYSDAPGATLNIGRAIGIGTAVGRVASAQGGSASPPYMTVREAADQILVERKTVYQWIKAGLLPCGTLPGGTEYRLRRTDWEDFVDGLFTGGNRASPPPQQSTTPTPSSGSRDASPTAACPGRKPDFFAIGVGSRRTGTGQAS
jgi:excisionase family DNA binding protein